MEGKMTRVAVLAACILVLLLSGQLAPVSGSVMSRYKDKCFRKCSLQEQRRALGAALADIRDGACREICLASVGCSMDAAAATTGGDRGPTDADVVACFDGCNGCYERMNANHV